MFGFSPFSTAPFASTDLSVAAIFESNAKTNTITSAALQVTKSLSGNASSSTNSTGTLLTQSLYNIKHNTFIIKGLDNHNLIKFNTTVNKNPDYQWVITNTAHNYIITYNPMFIKIIQK